MARSNALTNHSTQGSAPSIQPSIDSRSKSPAGTKAKPPHRYRNCGTPVRTGCRTCKIRRVKCGEEKPFCKRCTSTGRKCDGYEVFTSLKRRNGARTTPSISPGSVFNASEDPLEQQILDFFRTFTAPELSGNIASEFWEKKIFQAATLEPSIRHAILALGAIHKHYCEMHYYSDVSFKGLTQAFAFRQYAKAITTLRTSIVNEPQSLDMTLISCILFISFDCLVGDHASAMVHLNSGLKILDDINTTNIPSTSASQLATNYAPLLLAVGICAIADPNDAISRRNPWHILKKLGILSPSIPFRSLEDARYSLQTLGVDILCTRYSTMFSVSEDLVDTPFGLMARAHFAALDNWSRRFENFLHNTKSNPTIKTSDVGTLLLKAQYNLFCMNSTEPQTTENSFDEMLDLAEALVESSSLKSMPRVMIETGVIVPLAYTAVKSPKFEHKIRANRLLLQSPGREGLWNTDFAIRMVESALTDACGRVESVAIR